jgi:hypothetical protein
MRAGVCYFRATMETKNYNNENLEALRSLPPIPRNLELDEFLALLDEICVPRATRCESIMRYSIPGGKFIY